VNLWRAEPRWERKLRNADTRLPVQMQLEQRSSAWFWH
jgi:hypothetical protein